ncbi:MAG TPA: FkbM family methyltransferase [Steroidobacteraceae bacterium]|nr:FkbM family methyltransferase [Steroidobacteraceae bacterium]
MDTVTAIITTHKRPLLLRRALMSILSQVTEGLRIELIVSDDDAEASGLQAVTSIIGNAGTISLRYLKRPPDVSGVAASRNRALAQATGEWVLFLDDDDALRPNVISSLLRCAKESNAQACIGNYRICKECANGQITEIQEIQVTDARLYERLLVSNFIPIGSFIIQRSQIRSLFNENLKTLEDWLFLLDNFVSARVAVLNQNVVDVYISTDGARSHRNTESGQRQTAGDYARIYSLHPNAALYQARRNLLSRFPPVSTSELIGAPEKTVSLDDVVTTSQGRFFIANRNETIQRALLEQGAFEPLAANVAIAVSRLMPGRIIDIGANIGTFTVPVAKARPDALVVAVEPQQFVFRHLCANTLLNRLNNTALLQAAVGNTDRGASVRVPRFDVYEEAYTGSVSLDKEVMEIRSRIPNVAEPNVRASVYDDVSLFSLSQIIGANPVSFIKLDVEGMELEVLQSGEEKIRERRPFLYFETWTLPDFEPHRHRLLGFVKGLGYLVIAAGNDCFAFHPESIDPGLVKNSLAAHLPS